MHIKLWRACVIEYIENFFDVKDYDKNNNSNLTVKIIDKVEELYGKKIKPFPNSVQMVAYQFEIGTGCLPHRDWNGRSEITTLYYLNNDFEGGEIFFPNDDIKIKPTAGNLLVFDSKIKHGVTKVTSGIRWSIGAWWDFMEDSND